MTLKTCRQLQSIQDLNQITQIKPEPLGIFGGRKFRIETNDGCIRNISMDTVVKQFNSMIIKHISDADLKTQDFEKLQVIVASLHRADQDFTVSRQKNGFFKWLFTCIRRLGNFENRGGIFGLMQAKITQKLPAKQAEDPRSPTSKSLDARPVKVLPAELEQLISTVENGIEESKQEIKRLRQLLDGLDVPEAEKIIDRFDKLVIKCAEEVEETRDQMEGYTRLREFGTSEKNSNTERIIGRSAQLLSLVDDQLKQHRIEVVNKIELLCENKKVNQSKTNF